ncbi:unnamed protein product [Linum tenue]|uniref:GST N-terminal domain-containing protein n=1 Tax=Linum tenue TaxID=586396 RepID=A0AAV0NUL9_9ROSI|nr:unnamed protein product [Linum tenue]
MRRFWIQWHGLRSISSFLESMTPDISRQSEVKDSVVDIVGALVWILQYKSQAVVKSLKLNVLKLTRNIQDLKDNMVPSVEHNGKIMGEILDLIKYLYSNFEGPSLIPNDDVTDNA